MSAGQRLALIAVALVVLVGGFVVAQGAGDDDDTSPAAQTAAPEDPTETSTASGGTTAPEEAPATTETQPAPPAPRVETIRIRGGQPVGEPRTLKFESGDTIRLRFTSDAAAEVHIHGYDKYVDVPAGGSARTRFAADADGIFEIEDHGTGAVLAELEVGP